jgi:hypothetical protein
MKCNVFRRSITLLFLLALVLGLAMALPGKPLTAQASKGKQEMRRHTAASDVAWKNTIQAREEVAITGGEKITPSV